MNDACGMADYADHIRRRRRRALETPEYTDARRDEIAQRAWQLMRNPNECLDHINRHDLSSSVEVEYSGGRLYLLDAGIMLALIECGAERELLRCEVYDRIYEILTDEDGPIAREVDKEWSEA